MRLSLKLPLVVVGAILLTMIGAGTLSILVGRNTLHRQALNNSEHHLESYASAVGFYLDGARALLEVRARTSFLNELPRAREVAAIVLERSQVFEHLALLDTEGRVLMIEPRALEERLSHRELSFSPWFAELRNTGATVVSDLHISPATQRPSIVVAAPVRGDDGALAAVWVGALRLAHLSGIGASSERHPYPRGAAFLTDRRGLVIAHQKKLAYVEQQTDLSSVPAVAAALRGTRGVAELLNPVEAERQLAAYQPLADTGWAAVYSVPSSLALSALDTMIDAVVAGTAALAAGIGIAAVFFARRAAAPLVQLADAARSIGTGDFRLRLPPAGGDEIGELSVEFNRMAASLATQDAQLRQRAAALEAANRELEAFSYSVSHDLRAPLRAMDGFSLALIEDYGEQLDAEGRDALQRIRAASQRMGRLIDELLSLSRVTRAELKATDVDFSATAREIADTLQQTQPARPVRWEIAEGLKVRADPALLRIALNNLMDNAWKFTSKTARPEIRVGARANGGATEYFVADNGAGFDMAHAGRLFGAFQRLHHVDEFPGTGIGLAIVQRIVRRHGGVIRAEAKPGEGAAFLFTVGNTEDTPRG